MSPIFGALRLPASVIFGSGQRAAIGMITAQIGKRALICTDARLGGGLTCVPGVQDPFPELPGSESAYRSASSRMTSTLIVLASAA